MRINRSLFAFAASLFPQIFASRGYTPAKTPQSLESINWHKERAAEKRQRKAAKLEYLASIGAIGRA